MNTYLTIAIINKVIESFTALMVNNLFSNAVGMPEVKLGDTITITQKLNNVDAMDAIIVTIGETEYKTAFGGILIDVEYAYECRRAKKLTNRTLATELIEDLMIQWQMNTMSSVNNEIHQNDK